MLLFVVLGLVGVAYGQPAAGDCICVDGSGVNVRDAPCGGVIGSTGTGACYSALGGSQTCTLGGTSYTFWSFEYGAQTGWAANDYLVDEPDTSRCSDVCDSFTIVSRAQWGARPPSSTTGLGQTAKYFIHHSDGPPCLSRSDCEARVRGIQNYHMDSNGWSDIGYNFLVGEDGCVYEGRGWDIMGAHASGWNADAHGICVMGDFMSGLPNGEALSAVEDLMQAGISQGHVSSNYMLHGHRNGVCTSCPGDDLYNLISGWPNFGGNLPGSCEKNQELHDEH